MTDETSMSYVGTELETFKHAVNWKRYWGEQLSPHVSGDVCEVGAGIGGSTPFLLSPKARSWTLLEPDPPMAKLLETQRPECLSGLPSKVARATLADLPENELFDTITYIDVLEHIEADAAEVALAFSHLRTGGILIALSPACMALYSDFDKAVGHFRRYSLAGFQQLFTGAEIIDSGCLDFPGTALSLANRLMLRQSSPKAAQIAFWDKWIIPMARWIDPIIGRSMGRSVFVVARKPR